jgi:ABC-2 type transport system permease protein
MNIFLRELRSNLRSLLIWGVVVVLFVITGFSKFAAYEGNPELLAILDSMPPALMSALNFQAFNLTTITGFYGVMFSYFAIILSAAAVMWGSDIITKEERDKTVEFSLTLPVRRGKVVTAKTLAAAVNCIGLLLITWAAILVASTTYQTNGEYYRFVTSTIVALFLLQMIFLAVGVFLGCAMKHYKQATAAAMAILLGTFFLSIVSGLNENLEFLQYFSPFKYFNPAELLHEASIEPVYLLLTMVIVVVCLLGAYFTYARRDLYI